MKICELNINLNNSEAIDSIVINLKNMQKDLIYILSNIINDHKYRSDICINYKDVDYMQEIVGVISQISTQIKACEDGSKLIEG